MISGVVVGEDGLARCGWGAAPEDYRDYHDQEWGRPVHGDSAVFERITLEAFQSGLSWLTILRKRPGFRDALNGPALSVIAEIKRKSPSKGWERRRRFFRRAFHPCRRRR